MFKYAVKYVSVGGDFKCYTDMLSFQSISYRNSVYPVQLITTSRIGNHIRLIDAQSLKVITYPVVFSFKMLFDFLGGFEVWRETLGNGGTGWNSMILERSFSHLLRRCLCLPGSK